MHPLAIGLDLTDIARIRELLERHGDRFKERTFTAQEQTYCERCADPAIHYAARFAAKEAVSKALGTGFAEGVSWTHIEVLRAESGAPSIALHAAAAERAAVLGITRWLLSLTHTREVAAASVVGCAGANA
jgi:holo-[acyl-carrier protein] synthase